MSLGFGVGDFIAVAEIARKVYERCKHAPEAYAGLSTSVQVMARVLDETAEFHRRGSVPNDLLKKDAVVFACESCRITLDEVGKLLDKHSGMKKGKRLLDIWSFIKEDIESLKSKLELNEKILQLSLTSLSNLSILRVEQQLRQIVSDYKSGANKEKTVISDAIRENTISSEQELFDQLVIDLEEKGIHPDAIEVNVRFIQSWLKQAINTRKFVGLEDDPQPPPSHIELGSQDAAEATQQSSRSPADESNVLGPDDSDDGLPSIMNLDFSGYDSVSRPSSASSHRSKPDIWHPSNSSDPEYVQRMLEPLFQSVVQGAPSGAPDPAAETFNYRLMRAYHQLDYANRGHVSRADVAQTCEEALRRFSIPFDQGALARLISSHDVNRDGRIDLNEFLPLMVNLAARASAVLKEYLSTQLLAYCKKAEKLWSRPREGEPLPWPYEKIASGSMYRNKILETSHPSHPRLHHTSFSMMVFNSNCCIKTLDSLQKKWQPIIPHSLKSTFLTAFGSLRNAALLYALFENPDPSEKLSDLDYALIHLGIRDILESSRQSQVTCDLNSWRDYSYQYIQMVQGVVTCLEGLDLDLGPIAQANQFQRFNELWQSWHVSGLIAMMGSIEWDTVTAAIASFRSSSFPFRQDREQLTLSIARTHLGFTPWTLILKSVAILRAPLDMKKTTGVFRFSSKRDASFRLRVRIGRWGVQYNDWKEFVPAGEEGPWINLPEKDISGREFVYERHYTLRPDDILEVMIEYLTNSSQSGKQWTMFDTIGDFLPFLTRGHKTYSCTFRHGSDPTDSLFVRLNFESSNGELPLSRECSSILSYCNPFCSTAEALRGQNGRGDPLIGTKDRKRPVASDGRYFYLNYLGNVSWKQHPRNIPSSAPSVYVMPPLWTIEEDLDGNRVFFNQKTLERTTVRPVVE